jgi:hypothetical protein
VVDVIPDDGTLLPPLAGLALSGGSSRAPRFCTGFSRILPSRTIFGIWGRGGIPIRLPVHEWHLSFHAGCGRTAFRTLSVAAAGRGASLQVVVPLKTRLTAQQFHHRWTKASTLAHARLGRQQSALGNLSRKGVTVSTSRLENSTPPDASPVVNYLFSSSGGSGQSSPGAGFVGVRWFCTRGGTK